MNSRGLENALQNKRMVILDVILEQNWTDCKEVYYEAVQRVRLWDFPLSTRTIRMLEEMGVLKRVYQYVLPMNRENRSIGESEIIAPEFHGKAGSERLKRRRKNAVPSARHKRDNCQN